MPARQRGFARKRGRNNWRACWYDETGRERGKAGFKTKTEACDYAGEQAKRVLDGGAGVKAKTLNELFDSFLEKHGPKVDPATARKLAVQLRPARAAFGNRDPDGIEHHEWEDFHDALSAGWRHDAFRTTRQALIWAKRRKQITVNNTDGIKNPRRKQAEREPILPFQNWDEIERIAAEMDPRYAAIPVFATGTGLRPEEWIALEKTDIDWVNLVVTVQRRYSYGELKQGLKNGLAFRRVPLRGMVVAALKAAPVRVDTPLLFPAARGGYIDLDRFRYRDWVPALRAAGVAYRKPYATRHSFATWAIESRAVEIAELAKLMGTSIREIEDTYFRWLDRTDDRIRLAFDDFDRKLRESEKRHGRAA